MGKSAQELDLTKHGIPIYRTNPSIPTEGEITKSKRKSLGVEGKGFVVNNGTGEILGAGVAVAYEVDEADDEQFVKLFLSGIKQATGLSRSGLLVFQMVYMALRDSPKQDTVQLSRHETDMTKSTFYRGLRELLEGKFLFRSPYDGVFFVNVRYIFNGDRLAFVKAYHRKSAKVPPDQLSLFTGPV
jgi:hypothetical protein